MRYYKVAVVRIMVSSSIFRFERLKLKSLREVVCAKYFELLGVFSEEVDRVRKVSCF